MRRLVLVVKHPGFSLEDRPRLLAQLRSLIPRVSNVRIASDHLEVDVVADDLVGVVEAVGKVVGEVSEVVDLGELRGRAGGVEDAVRLYADLFDRERFVEAHEVIDGVIERARDGREALVLKGLALIAGAYAHAQSGRHDLAKRILTDVLDLLNDLQGEFYGIDLRKLRGAVRSSIGVTKVKIFSVAQVRAETLGRGLLRRT